MGLKLNCTLNFSKNPYYERDVPCMARLVSSIQDDEFSISVKVEALEAEVFEQSVHEEGSLKC